MCIMSFKFWQVKKRKKHTIQQWNIHLDVVKCRMIHLDLVIQSQDDSLFLREFWSLVELLHIFIGRYNNAEQTYFACNRNESLFCEQTILPRNYKHLAAWTKCWHCGMCTDYIDLGISMFILRLCGYFTFSHNQIIH